MENNFLNPLWLVVSVLKSLLENWSLTSELLSLRQSKWLEGHWLQLICCTLPKCLCPLFQTRRLTSEILSVQRSEGWRVGGSEVQKCKAVDDLIFELANVTESLSYLTED